MRNSGLQNQDVLWTADGPDCEGTVLIDPNSLSEQGTTALSAIAVSESGELVASATSDAGSDWRTWGVRRVATGEELPDRVAWSKFASAAWTHDDGGFFYGRYPEPSADAAYDAPNRDMELRYHLLGARPGRRPSRLRHSPGAGMGLRARGLRRRPAAHRHRLARHRPRQPDLRRRSR